MAPRQRDYSNDFGVATWLLVALILQIGASRWHATDTISVDYFTLWAVPATLSSVPDRDIYSHDNQRAMATAARAKATADTTSPAHKLVMGVSDQLYEGRIDATGSPLVYALVGLTSTGRYDDDLDRFTIASFIAFVVSIGLLCRLLGFSPTGTAVAAVAYGLCFSPLLAEVRVVNVNQLQLFALSLFLWLSHRNKTALAGTVLGIAIAFKPNIVVVLVIAGLVAFIGRRLRESLPLFAGAAAGAGVAVAASAAYFGSIDVWRHFLASIGRTLQVGYPLEQGNYGLASIIATLSGAEVSLVLAVFAIAVVLFVLVRTRPRHDSEASPSLDEQFLTVGIGCALMLLASRLVWIHYYVLLIPLSLYLLRPTPEAPGRQFGPIAAGVALLLLSPAAQAIPHTPLYTAVNANIATLLLFAAGLHAWWTMRLADGSSKKRSVSRRGKAHVFQDDRSGLGPIKHEPNRRKLARVELG
jgi:hypothetical protein